MRLFKFTALSIAAAGVLVVGTAPALAAPHRGHKPHQVCKVQRVHGHAKRVCHWVR